MKIRKTLLTATTILSTILLSATAHAALYDRGNGMIYDSGLNITWLQDANYVKSSGYDAGLRPAGTEYAGLPEMSPDGGLTRRAAIQWVNNLEYGGYSDWRLPTIRNLSLPVGSCCEPAYFTGETVEGWNSTYGEIGHLFFELGNHSPVNTEGVLTPGSGWAHMSFIDPDSGQEVYFQNILSMNYPNFWYYTKSAPLPLEWFFSDGMQNNIDVEAGLGSWAVRDGDVALSSVPVPAAAWFFGSSLIGLTGVARKRKTT